MAEYHLGYSRFVAIGNQADVDTPEVLRSFVGHAPTRAVVVYAEELRDGREFARAAHELVGSGTPVVLLAPGRSAASARVARTHTGSLTSDSVAVDAACRAAGVLRVDTQREALETLVALLGAPRPAGRRVAVVSDGGGTGAICADAARLAGLERAAVRRRDAGAAARGPAGERRLLQPGRLRRRHLRPRGLRARDRHGGRLRRGRRDPGQRRDRLLGRALSRRRPRWSRRSAPACCGWPRRCARAVCRCSPTRRRAAPSSTNCAPAVCRSTATSSRRWRRWHASSAAAEPPLGVPELPPPADRRRRPPKATGRRAGPWRRPACRWSRRGGCASRVRRAVTDERVEAALAAAAAELGYPVALKAAGLLHKSDAGGVVLGIADDEALVAAVGRPPRAPRARRRRPRARAHGAARRRRRADRRLPLGRPFRPAADARHRGALHRAARRRADGAGAGGRGRSPRACSSSCAARRSCRARAAGRRSTSRPRRAPPRPSRASPPRTPRSPPSRSTPCSSFPTAPSVSTHASSSPRRARRDAGARRGRGRAGL